MGLILYIYILIFSWLLGALKISATGWKLAALDLFKGALAIFAARLVNDTGLTMTAAALGVMVGHSWSPIMGFRERPARWVALGALAAFTPLVGWWALAAAVLVYYLSGSMAVAQLSVSLFLPFLLWQVKQFDIYVIFGLILTIILVYQAVPLLNPDRTAIRKRLRLRQLLAVTVIIALAVLLFFNRYVYRGFGQQVDIIRRGTPEFKVVAITFDDGPDPLYTPGILDILQEYNVPATFFMVGRHVQQYPDIVRRIVEDGHSVGNHTWSHRSLVPLSVDQTRLEIMQAHYAIEAITGTPPRLFRPPRGVYSSFARTFLREQEYTIVLWDVTSQDWAELPSRRIADNVLNNVSPGSIILFHDSGNLISAEGGNRINTVRALPLVIEGLQQQGYSFLTIDDLIILTGLTGEEGLD